MTFEDAVTATKGLLSVIQSLTERLEADFAYNKGISLLTVKNDLLLSYLHHLTLLVHLKLSGRALADHQELVQELVRIRVILDKIRPLESKLKYQINKLLRKAQLEGPQTLGEEEVANDPLSFRPNPAAMMSRDGDAASGSDSEPETRPKDGLYRPPRVAPTPYIEPPRVRKGKTKALPPNEMLADLVTTATSVNDPYAEPTSGLASAPSLGGRRERELDEMDRYEEANMTRLFQPKKAAKKRRDDEARRAGASQRAGFADLDDFVGALGSNARRSSNAYDALRSAPRPMERISLPADGSAPNLKRKRPRHGSSVQRKKR